MNPDRFGDVNQAGRAAPAARHGLPGLVRRQALLRAAPACVAGQLTLACHRLRP
jgi:hypothetical protein